jgi:AraC family transcriptional regulator of adaptative response/methylated-DNA-[protein]-cysteine methyltransferase
VYAAARFPFGKGGNDASDAGEEDPMAAIAPIYTASSTEPSVAVAVLTSPPAIPSMPSDSVAEAPTPLYRKEVGDQEELAAARWRAIEGRDRAADGSFVFAVTTTGVYCRPSCPARRPRPENVRFFDDGAAARTAGFRACLRCEPDKVLLIDQAVARVRERLDAAEGESVPLAELARITGLSPFHLQREFKRRIGLTPKQYALAHRAERLKTEMQRSPSVLDAGFGAGYGSSSRLYAESVRRLGMTPGRFRDGGRGVEIRFAITATAVGSALVAATDRGVCAVRLGADAAKLAAGLRRDFPNATVVADPKRLRPFLDAVKGRLERASEAGLPTDLDGTAFQRQVWEELRRIPSGETRSYAEIARAIGRPSAARAVARACATNPVALVVPCHRVVGSNGALTGYRWGVARKKALLELEKVRAKAVAEQR